MSIDLLGPASAVGAVLARPAETRVFGPSDTWFNPCSSQSSRDGTQMQAVFLNGLLAQLRYALRASGIELDNDDDAMLWEAIRTLTPPPALWHSGSDTSTNAAGLIATVAPAVSAYEMFVAYSIKVNNNAVDGGTQANFGLGLRTVVRADGTPVGEGDWIKGQVILLIDDGTRLQLVGAPSGDVIETQISTTLNTLLIAGGRTSVFAAPGAITWTAPEGATLARVIAVGAGGGGGGAASGGSGGGGGGGGYVEGVVPVVAGQTYSGLVGGGGAGGLSNGQASTAGGTSSFSAGGKTLSATGGTGGAFGSGTNIGLAGQGGTGAGGDLNFAGSLGQNGIYIPTGTANDIVFGGIGGGSRYSPSTPYPYGSGSFNGTAPGGAGSGAAGTSNGGAGFPGIVIIMA